MINKHTVHPPFGHSESRSIGRHLSRCVHHLGGGGGGGGDGRGGDDGDGGGGHGGGGVCVRVLLP